LETIQVIIYHPVSLIVQKLFQGINSICFHIDQKELTPELLFKLTPELDRKDAGICLLVKEVLRPPCSLSIFEKGKSPEDFLLVTAKLLWDQTQI